MSLITGLIPKANFEVVRDQIAAILVDELANQKSLYQVAYDGETDPVIKAWYKLNVDSIPDKVYIERFIRPQSDEMPVLNVVFTGAPLDALITSSTQVGVTKYQIEGYASSKATEDDPSDKLASLKLHRLLAICRSIIMNENYNRLGFDTAPFLVGYRQCLNLIIGQPEDGADDSKSSIFGKFDVDVKLTEGVEIISGIDLEESFTNVKLHETEQGLHFEYIKT